jgi:putative PIN family toxin of toxin-antitoxin system
MTWRARWPRSGGLGLRVVVDTNVWVSGLIAPSGTPGRVLDAIRAGAIEPVVTWALADELVTVLRRPALRRYGFTDGDVEDVLVLLGPFLPDVEVTVDIRDPADAPVVSAALAGRAEAIVTGDRDLLDDDDLRHWLAARGVTLLTPAELLAGR